MQTVRAANFAEKKKLEAEKLALERIQAIEDQQEQLTLEHKQIEQDNSKKQRELEKTKAKVIIDAQVDSLTAFEDELAKHDTHSCSDSEFGSALARFFP